jgi:hypothetical protein
MENENEVITQENDTETTENEEVVIEEETTEAEEDAETLKKKIQTLEAQKEHWRKKAEKPKVGEKETPVTNTGLSTKDTIAIMNAKVHEDDIDEVVEYARFKKIPISEALKSSVIKASLSEREEKRTSGNAANTRNASRGSSQVSVEKLVSDASTGKLPEKDEDIQRLLKAKMGLKK